MKLIFLGSKKYAAEMLAWTVSTGHDVVGILSESRIPDPYMGKVSSELKIPLLSVSDAVKIAPETDLAVLYLYPRIIKQPLISAPRLGCINFHPAPLPDWKGSGGYNMAILNHLTRWGATAHVVDAHVDTGPIIDVAWFDIDPKQETAQSLAEKTQLAQQQLYKKVLTAIARNYKLPDDLKPNEGGMFISRHEMLDMMEIKPGDDVETKIRAFWFPPYHGAYVTMGGQKYTLVSDFILQRLAMQENKDK